MSGSICVPPGVGLTITAPGIGEPQGGFAFLTNVVGIAGASALELIPGHTLRKASADEITVIKEVLLENNGRLPGNHFFPWEMKRSDGCCYDSAPEEDWNYFVIAFAGTNEGIFRLEQAFVLLDASLRIGFTVMSWGTQRGVFLHAGRLFQALQENSTAILTNSINDHTLSVAKADALQISALVERLSEHRAASLDILRVSHQLLSLHALDCNSDMALLGYFSVLESLLVHKPNPNDSNDSITRQIRKKINLLDNRWLQKIDYSAFKGSDPESTWTKMYELRSAIAHGDVPDFKQKLRNLKDLRNAQSLLTRTVRAVARHALHEPQLVADLREC